MSEENVEIVRRSIAVYNRRDLEALRGINHPNVELDWSASIGLEARVYQGREQVLSFYENYLDTFEEIDIQADRFIEAGDWVVVPNTTHLRGRDGIQTAARSAFAFKVRDALITHICLYQETEEALEAVGLSE
jgi:ketosteroid isomerase-like protein